MLGDASSPFDPRPIPDDLRERWLEKGLPIELLERGYALRMPRAEFERLLFWADAEAITRFVDWFDRATNGTMRWRQLTPMDNDEMIDLWRNAPEQVGDWDVTVERGPNAFAQFQLQENPSLTGLFDRSVLVACVSFSLRNTYVGGQKMSVRYAQALRVRQDVRRGGYGNWVRSLPWPIGITRPTQAQYDFIRTQNETVVSWLHRYSPGLINPVPKREGEAPGQPVTVLQYPAGRSTGDARGMRAARDEDIPACVELINRTREGLDLFRPYTPEFLRNRLDEGFWGERPPGWTSVYAWPDLLVLEEDGQIVACAGLWDRGRDIREHWRHRESGEEKSLSVTAMIDFGFAPGREDAMVRMIEHLIDRTHDLGRDYLVAPLEQLPDVAVRLESYEPLPETRSLLWRLESPQITRPDIDLIYW